VLNIDTSSMDTDIPDTSTIFSLTNGHLQYNEMKLGLHTPYKTSKVLNLKKFRFEKAIGRIVKQHTRKVPITGGNPLSIITKTMITEDVIKDSLSIAYVDIASTEATK